MQVSNQPQALELTKEEKVKAITKELAKKIKDRNSDPNCFFANYLVKYTREKLFNELVKK